MKSYLQMLNDDILGIALTTEMAEQIRAAKIPVGVYAGYDPAEVNDRSGFIIVSKDPPTLENPKPTLKVRTIKDLSVGKEGIKNVSYMQQANRIIELDRTFHFNKICIDITRDKFMVEYIQGYLGSRVEGITFSKPLKSDLITAVRVIFQEKLIQLNKSQKNYSILRKELYELDPRNLKHPDNGTDDFVWALALAIKATDAVNYKPKVISGEYNDEFFYF